MQSMALPFRLSIVTTRWLSCNPMPSSVSHATMHMTSLAIVGLTALWWPGAHLQLVVAFFLAAQGLQWCALFVCRLTSGASLSKQDQADMQRVRSSLLQLANRKRSRAASGIDRGADRDSSPSTSTAARSQDRAYRRTTSAHEGGATSKPYKPARCAQLKLCKQCCSWHSNC